MAVQKISKTEKSKQQIIDASVECINEGGIKNLSFRNVAQKIDIAIALINYHFKTKENLILEVFKNFGAEHYKKISEIAGDKSIPPSERLDKMVNISYRGVDNSESLEMWLAFWSLRSDYKQLQDLHIKHYNQITTDIENIFIEMGYENPSDKATALLSMINGLWLEHSMGNKSVPFNQAITIINNFIESK